MAQDEKPVERALDGLSESVRLAAEHPKDSPKAGPHQQRATRYPFAPGVRRTSTGGTAEAAAALVRGSALTLEQRALVALQDGTATPEELKARFEDELGRSVLLNSVRPRLSALKARGLVKDSGERRPGEGGRCMAIAWRLATAEELSLFLARRAADAEHGEAPHG